MMLGGGLITTSHASAELMSTPTPMTPLFRLDALLKGDSRHVGDARSVSRIEISDESWAVIDLLLLAAKTTDRPPMDGRAVVEATA